MAIYRIYTGADGESHVEKQDLKSHPFLTQAQKAQTLTFREMPAGRFQDWHPAPRRQYIISISGEVEIGFHDGSTIRFYPGDARLLEDTTGRGHTTRVIGDQPAVTMVVPLAD